MRRPSTDEPPQIVSIHDVAPATAAQTGSWLADLGGPGVRATLLVVAGPWREPGAGDAPE